jgi:putative DNA-invertase from lambdoid prophage Rac
MPTRARGQSPYCIEDIGSGAKERPKREQLIKMAKRREIDAIIVLRLDRWGRPVPDLMGTLKDFAEIGVNFVAIEQAIGLN